MLGCLQLRLWDPTASPVDSLVSPCQDVLPLSHAWSCLHILLYGCKVDAASFLGRAAGHLFTCLLRFAPCFCLPWPPRSRFNVSFMALLGRLHWSILLPQGNNSLPTQLAPPPTSQWIVPLQQMTHERPTCRVTSLTCLHEWIITYHHYNFCLPVFALSSIDGLRLVLHFIDLHIVLTWLFSSSSEFPWLVETSTGLPRKPSVHIREVIAVRNPSLSFGEFPLWLQCLMRASPARVIDVTFAFDRILLLV